MPRPIKSLEANLPSSRTYAMNAKALSALLVALFFQAGQIIQGADVAFEGSQKSEGNSCNCGTCVGDCACAKSGQMEQNPVPLTHESNTTLKLPSAEPEDRRVSVPPNDGDIKKAKIERADSINSPMGYAGVPISVALCSMVI